MYMGGSLLTVNEGDDVWMMEAFQDVNFRVEVLFEFLVELVHIYRLDRNEAWFLLQ